MSDMTSNPPIDAAVIVTEEPRRDFVSRLGMAARENPAAAALIAMGGVWLFAGGSKVSILGRSRSGRDRRPHSLDYPADTPAPSVVGLHVEGAMTAAENTAQDGGRVLRRAGEETGDLVKRAKSMVGDAAEAVTDAAEDAARGMSSAARQAGSAAADATRTTSRALRGRTNDAWHEGEDLGRSVREMLEDQPLAIAALSLAAGAGLAFALPRTQAERDLLGEQSEALRESMQSIATQRIDEAREAAEETLATAMRDARENGLSEDAVREAVADFTAKLEKVARAGKTAAEEDLKDKTGKS